MSFSADRRTAKAKAWNLEALLFHPRRSTGKVQLTVQAYVIHNNHDSSCKQKTEHKFQKEGKNHFGITEKAEEIVAYNSKCLLHISIPDYGL